MGWLRQRIEPLIGAVVFVFLRSNFALDLDETFGLYGCRGGIYGGYSARGEELNRDNFRHACPVRKALLGVREKATSREWRLKSSRNTRKRPRNRRRAGPVEVDGFTEKLFNDRGREDTAGRRRPSSIDTLLVKLRVLQPQLL